MADFKQGTTYLSVQLTGGPLLPPQNSTNQNSTFQDTNFVSGGGTSNDFQYLGNAWVDYLY